MNTNDQVTLAGRINQIHDDQTAYIVLRDGQNVYTSLKNCDPVGKFLEVTTLPGTVAEIGFIPAVQTLDPITREAVDTFAAANALTVVPADEYKALKEKVDAAPAPITKEAAEAVLKEAGAVVLTQNEHAALLSPPVVEASPQVAETPAAAVPADPTPKVTKPKTD